MNTAPFLLAAALALVACSTPSTRSQRDLTPIAGRWRATLAGTFHLEFEVSADQIRLTDGDADNDIVVVPREYAFDGRLFSMVFDHSPFMPPHIEPPTPGHGDFTMTAEVRHDVMTGTGTRADGKPFGWTAERVD